MSELKYDITNDGTKIKERVGNTEDREISEFSDNAVMKKKVSYADIVRINTNMDCIENRKMSNTENERSTNALILSN